MDKKTILKVFGEAFLRSMVVLMAIAILGFSAFFLIKVNADKKEQKSTTEQGSTLSQDELDAMVEEENANDTKEATTEEVTTEATTEATTEELNIPSTDKNIMVLNSTSVAGLASSWQTKLNNSGFANVAIGNYNLEGQSQTRIYVSEEGMGKDLAEYFKDAVIEVGTVDSANYVIKGGASMSQVDIFIVIGSNDSTVQ